MLCSNLVFTVEKTNVKMEFALLLLLSLFISRITVSLLTSVKTYIYLHLLVFVILEKKYNSDY